MPMPDASAIGRFDTIPMQMVMSADPKHVAVNAAESGMPAPSGPMSMGFTAMMYAIARNVVIPPTTSADRELPRSAT